MQINEQRLLILDLFVPAFPFRAERVERLSGMGKMGLIAADSTQSCQNEDKVNTFELKASFEWFIVDQTFGWRSF